MTDDLYDLVGDDPNRDLEKWTEELEGDCRLAWLALELACAYQER